MGAAWEPHAMCESALIHPLPCQYGHESEETLYYGVSQTCSQTPFGIETTDPRILPHVNMECPDDRYPEFKTFMSELILDSYKYTPATHVTMHCTILP